VKFPLPPITGREEALLKTELAMCGPSRCEDAIGEAWVAHLEGRRIVRAVNTYRKRESRRAARELTDHPALARMI